MRSDSRVRRSLVEKAMLWSLAAAVGCLACVKWREGYRDDYSIAEVWWYGILLVETLLLVLLATRWRVMALVGFCCIFAGGVIWALFGDANCGCLGGYALDRRLHAGAAGVGGGICSFLLRLEMSRCRGEWKARPIHKHLRRAKLGRGG